MSASRGGKVAALAKGLPRGAKEIDATGKLVLPGGIDSHTHIEEPRGGPTVNADTFASGTASAAVGGTTTVIGFARQPKGGSIAQGVAEHMERARAGARIDYCFHMILTDPRPEVLEKELPPLVEAGHRTFKIFLTYDGTRISDAEALRVLATARKLGALTCIHAENHELIAFYTEALLAAGYTRPIHHAWAKPMIVERECVNRVCAMSEALDAPIQVFHVSGGEAADEIARAQARGVKVWGETCTQYLVLTADDLDKPGIEGAKALCSPAPRSRRPTRRRCGRRSGSAPSRTSPRTMRRRASRGRTARARSGRTRPSPSCRTACPASPCACRSCSARAWRRGGSPCPSSSRSPRRMPRGCSGWTTARAASRWGWMPTSPSGTRRGR